MSEPIPRVPLLYEGDAFYITVDRINDHAVKITSIERYENNESTTGSIERFWDLNEDERNAVRRQVGRRFPGCSIAV